MDLTKKIKSLVTRQPSSSHLVPETESFDVITSDQILSKPKLENSWMVVNNPQEEEEVLQSIEDVYFSADESFDSGVYELKKFPEEIDVFETKNFNQKLKKQLNVVRKRGSNLILQNSTSFSEQLNHVTELQKSLDQATFLCVESRRNLQRAKKDFTSASLGIVASYQKKEKLKALVRSLQLIKTLQQTDVRLRELLEEEDYPGAIQLCLECQKAASTFKQYKCISELTSKLQDTLEMTEEQLDVALSKVCTNFNSENYQKLHDAYKLLGKTQAAMDQLLMHFTSVIHNKAFTIILGFVELSTNDREGNFQKRQYHDLCKNISTENFIPCLLNLCKSMWEVMRSYWSILEWHEAFDSGPMEDEESGGSPAIEANFNRRYIKQKLEHGLLRVWQDVQQRVKTYLLSSDLSSFKFDDFIKVLDIVRRLIVIGEEFCGSKSEDLQESLQKQTVNYFKNYHRGCLEELRMFLENETWEICPVQENFSILHLQEFRFLRIALAAKHQGASGLTPSKVFNDSTTGRNPPLGKKMQSNPFEKMELEDEGEDLSFEAEEESFPQHVENADSDDSDVPDEIKQDYVDEQTGEVPVIRKISKHSNHKTSSNEKTDSLIITNTTLNVLRLFGKYMQMMNVLQIISFDVLICMSQLFDYYMYAVYSFFAQALTELSENSFSNKLRVTLKRIRENLMLQVFEDATNNVKNKDKVLPPCLSPMVDLSSPEKLFGLAKRIAATESLIFLSKQFEFLCPHFEALIPAPRRAFLQQYSSQTISVAPELRCPTYIIVAHQMIDYKQVLSLMATVKWDIRDIMSQHSYYVDILLRELQVFSMRLCEVEKTIPVSKEVKVLLWEHAIRLINHTFVEGFSQAKKCTNEGRALMQLDYQQFLSKVERMSEIHPIPDRELVDNYVKAYYMLEPALEKWINSHKEYTAKQLISLVNCITQVNKKGRQRLINMIEESDRYKR